MGICFGYGKADQEASMKNVLVTNGSALAETAEKLLPYVDAMNIDLKGFREEYYRKLGGSLLVVKEFITRAVRECHVELTTLIIPGKTTVCRRWRRRLAGSLL